MVFLISRTGSCIMQWQRLHKYMANTLYWSVYKNLEKEVLELSQWVYIDDRQLDTYSVKTADLLMRTAVEIESLSKALYFKHGGTKPDDNDLYFDTDCLKLLHEKFNIGSKVVLVSDVFQYCVKGENIKLTPLHNSWKNGKCDWKKAYQAVKHDRYNQLKKGNIKHLLRALASLFLLNLYFMDRAYPLSTDLKAVSLDPRMGSDLFSVKIHTDNINITETSVINKQPDFDECVYVVQPIMDSITNVRDTLLRFNSEVNAEKDRLFLNKMNRFVADGTVPSFREYHLVPDEKKQPLMVEAYREAFPTIYSRYNDTLRDVYQRVEYEAVLNTNQY